MAYLHEFVCSSMRQWQLPTGGNGLQRMSVSLTALVVSSLSHPTAVSDTGQHARPARGPAYGQDRKVESFHVA